MTPKVTASGFDRARWAAVSAQLDDLLLLDAPARTARLAELRHTDAALADELGGLLARIDAQDDATFMRVDAAPAGIAAPGRAGQAVGAYRIERLLGEGGMGSVWLGQRSDGRYDARVAIKFLRSGRFGGSHSTGDSASRRFAREGQILARVDHPNIGRLLDAGLTEGTAQPYLVLEYIDGEPIDRHCEARGLGVAARLQLFDKVLQAVAYAHSRLILHRDLKPSNILVTSEGQVKLLDFGIARLFSDALDVEAAGRADSGLDLTLPANRLFTPRYAAPEQVQGGDLTPATDVYALGVLLYGLLTGEHPTPPPRTGGGSSATGGSLDQLRAVLEVQPRTMSETVRRPTAPRPVGVRRPTPEPLPAAASRTSRRRRVKALQGDLDTIVAKALKKRPAERYRSAAEMADDLQRHLRHEPVSARPDSLAYRTARLLHRHWLFATGAATLALGLSAGLGVALLQAREAAAQRAHAESLIEFMLGDLRDKLQPVGRLDVLDGVGERVLAYYNAQDASRLDAASLGRRARALQGVAGLAAQRLRLDEAERLYRQAAAITGGLMARFPNDATRIAEHSASLSGLAVVRTERDPPAAAEPDYRAALALAERASTLAPDNFDFRVAVASARSDLGSFLVDTDRAVEALPILGVALVDYRRFVAERPTPVLRQQLLNLGSILADADYGLGLYRDAIAAVDGHWDALKRIPGGEQDRELQMLRSLGLNRMSVSELNLGRVDLAQTVAEEVVARTAALVALEPSNLELLDRLCYQRLQLAEILDAARLPALAQAQLPLVEAGRQRLLAANPTGQLLRLAMRGRLLALAGTLAPGEPAVLAPLRSFFAEANQAEAQGEVIDANPARQVAAAGLAYGEALAAQGRRDEATPVWTRALQWLVPQADVPAPFAKYLRARLHLRLNQLADARHWVDVLEATEYRPPAYLALRDALQQAERSADAPAAHR